MYEGFHCSLVYRAALGSLARTGSWIVRLVARPLTVGVIFVAKPLAAGVRLVARPLTVGDNEVTKPLVVGVREVARPLVMGAADLLYDAVNIRIGLIYARSPTCLIEEAFIGLSCLTAMSETPSRESDPSGAVAFLLRRPAIC